MKLENFKDKLVSLCEKEYHAQPRELTANQLHCAVSKLVMEELSPVWDKSRTAHDNARKASYLSMEFLVGRAIYNNLLCLGILDSTAEELKALGVDISEFEEVEDAALGNGGLGILKHTKTAGSGPVADRHRRVFRWTATEYAISTACSSRASRTDSRPKPQTIGRDTATRGAFVVSRMAAE